MMHLTHLDDRSYVSARHLDSLDHLPHPLSPRHTPETL
ncbi:hypothetical protein FDH74_gp43 [Propionibacterium phage PHL082M03]|uniref:Uncharacterized protein n=2 Tax=Pahexavirus PHL082M03 TaxID=1982281 RepID=A0A0E3DKQ9_9CAUD|nr:hypothetical protein FDH74_gp43 [Propionibacterium phage PHL082M03]AII29078.1 hypothetical protein PHL082M00_44 [Propionibacterium phage PHL082M00]AII29170.1 hypothetical protein PHL082M03_43 [Propionibacterium phage PHL082M03]AII29216.1 hypothetical protein PHL082M04_43 [Propionibacterium phage PHL082M04]